MSKKHSRTRRSTDRTVTTDIVTQLEVAIRNPHAALIGALMGGLVPWFGRTLAHGEIQDTWPSNRTLALAMVVVVLGCGCFSGLSVYKFGKIVFNNSHKALGFVLALEGVMLVAHGATSTVALIALILINAVSNGSVIALARDASCRKRDADARRAASRRKASTTGVPTAAPTTHPSEKSHQSPIVVGPTAPVSAQSSPGIGLVRWTPMPQHCDVIDAEILS